MATRTDTVVVGGGQAGLNVSRALQMADVDHLVFERGRVGEVWASQRWESFRLNTPNRVNGLLGADYDGPDPGGFMTAAELRERMVAFVERFELPVHENTAVRRVGRADEGLDVELADGSTVRCRSVVVCSGSQNVPAVPPISERIGGVDQLHAAEYRRPDQLAEGAVLVVGSAQSGGQIAEELAASGRTTYLSTSNIASVPRRYRGRDIADWMEATGVVFTPVESLEDPSARYAAQPLMTGADGGRTVTLHSLARRGVNLLGRLSGVDGAVLGFDGDLAENAAKGLASISEVRSNLDRFIAATGLDAPEAEADPATLPADALGTMREVRELDLVDRGITTVIWATGYRGDFAYLDVGLERDDHGVPVHDGGASSVDGLWFCGFPWLRIQMSGLIHGSGVDAKAVVDQLVAANDVRPWGASALC